MTRAVYRVAVDAVVMWHYRTYGHHQIHFESVTGLRRTRAPRSKPHIAVVAFLGASSAGRQKQLVNFKADAIRLMGNRDDAPTIC